MCGIRVLDRYKYNDAAAAHLAAYAIELAYAYQDDLRRPVWVEEIGVSSKECPLDYQPKYMEDAVRNIAATGKAWGITWWGSHDIDRADKSFDFYEYELGLIDQQNRPKPLGKKFAELAAELRRTPQPVGARSTALVIPEFGLSTQAWPPDWRFAGPYMKLIERHRAGDRAGESLPGRPVFEGPWHYEVCQAYGIAKRTISSFGIALFQRLI